MACIWGWVCWFCTSVQYFKIRRWPRKNCRKKLVGRRRLLLDRRGLCCPIVTANHRSRLSQGPMMLSTYYLVTCESFRKYRDVKYEYDDIPKKNKSIVGISYRSALVLGPIKLILQSKAGMVRIAALVFGSAHINPSGTSDHLICFLLWWRDPVDAQNPAAVGMVST